MLAVFVGGVLQVNRPGSRIFALKFPSEPERTILFWAQDPDPASDQAFVDAANLAFNSVLDGKVYITTLLVFPCFCASFIRFSCFFFR